MCKIVSGVLLVLGIGIIIAGAVVGWVVFPKLITEQVELKEGTEQYERFAKLPIPFNFSVYVFDVQNPDQLIDGSEKPKIVEKGPYLSIQRREKHISKHANGEVIYREFQKYTVGDFTDEVTILNPALTSTAQLSDNSLTAGVFNKYYEESFGNHKHPFVTSSVKELLFDGYKFCAAANALCLILLLKSKETRNIRIDADGSLIFSFFYHKMVKDDGEYKIDDGTVKVSNLGWIKEWNGSPYLKNMWKEEKSECNKVGGRDSVLYAPFVEKEYPIAIFNTDICRKVDLDFEAEVQYKEATAYKFSINKNTLNIKDTCYCLNDTHGFTNPTGCPKNGVMELKNCYGAPILLSFPHFLWADKEYTDEVDAMKPDEKKHLTFVELEPTTGTPFRGYRRIQMNMFLKPMPLFKVFQKSRNTIIPLIWIEEAVEVTDDLYKILDDAYLSKKGLIEIGKWTLIGVGIALVALGAVLFFWKRGGKTTV